MRAVLFDLDGTLLDHEGAARAALTAWLPTLGLEATDSVQRRWFEAERRFGDLWRAGRLTWQEQRRRRLRAVVPATAERSDGEVDAAFAGYLRRYEAEWRAFDDVVPALDGLLASGTRVAVLTDGATEQQHRKLDVMGIRDRFEFVLTAEDLGVGKPDRRAFDAAVARFGLPAADVLHVGDVPAVDVDGAEAAGLRAVLIDRSAPTAGPRVLQSLAQLVEAATGSPRDAAP